MFPSEFVGPGDMSRGGCSCGVPGRVRELEYIAGRRGNSARQASAEARARSQSAVSPTV